MSAAEREFSNIEIKSGPRDETDVYLSPIDDRCAFCLDRAQAYQRLFENHFISEKGARSADETIEFKEEAVRLAHVRAGEEQAATPPKEQAEKRFPLSSKAAFLAGLFTSLYTFQLELEQIKAQIAHEEETHQLSNDEWSQRKQELLVILKAREKIIETHLLLLAKHIFWSKEGVSSFLIQVHELREFEKFLSRDDIQERAVARNVSGTASAAEVFTPDRIGEYLQLAKQAVEDMRYKDLSFFAYKQDTANLRSAKQATPLIELEQAAFGDLPETDIASETQALAAAILEKQQAQLKRLYEYQEEAPYTAYLYDFLLAAFLTDDLSLIREASLRAAAFVEEHRSKIQREIRTMGQKFHPEIKAIKKRVNQVVEKTGAADQTKTEVISQFSPLDPECPYVIGISYDRMVGLDAFLEWWKRLEGMDGAAQINNLIRQYWRGAETQLKRKRRRHRRQLDITAAIDNDLEIDQLQSFSYFWRSLIGAHFPEASSLDPLVSVWMDKEDYLKSKKRISKAPVGVDTKEHAQEAVKALSREYEKDERDSLLFLITEYQLQGLYVEQGQNITLEKIAELEKDTEIRLSNAFYNNRWLIADWGDRFVSESDEELEKLGIKSLTFYPLMGEERAEVRELVSDREHLLFYKVVVETADLPEQMSKATLYLTENGDFYLSSGAKFRHVKWVEAPFRDLIARRLEYATTAPDLTNEEKATSEQEGLKPRLYRRAHWRFLPAGYKPTEEQIETVKALYGIDIIKRNAWLHSQNRLPEDQFVTFVRASEVKRDQPNILVYQPVEREFVEGITE